MVPFLPLRAFARKPVRDNLLYQTRLRMKINTEMIYRSETGAIRFRYKRVRIVMEAMLGELPEDAATLCSKVCTALANVNLKARHLELRCSQLMRLHADLELLGGCHCPKPGNLH
jgi:hypothetical protein